MKGWQFGECTSYTQRMPQSYCLNVNAKCDPKQGSNIFYRFEIKEEPHMKKNMRLKWWISPNKAQSLIGQLPKLN